MKPFKVSMEKGDGMELYGQGHSLTEALANLIRAVDEYGDRSDKVSIMEATDDLRDRMPVPRVLGPGGGKRPPFSLALELAARAENKRRP